MIKRTKIIKKTEIGIEEKEDNISNESPKNSIHDTPSHNPKRSIQWKSLVPREVVLSFIRKHKKGLSVFCVAIMLTVAWFGFISKLFEKKEEEKENSGLMIASQPVYLTNKVVVINTSLIIEGLYQLDNSTLKMNGSADGSIKIEVQEGGNLRLLNNSKITWGDTGKYYSFFIYQLGTLYSDNSTIERVWGVSGGGSNGLNIASNGTNIHYSEIINNYGNGATISNASPGIYHTNISGNGINGLVIEGSTNCISEPTISNCIINNNDDAGIRIENYSNPYIVDNVLMDNQISGIVVNSSVFTDEKITSFSSGFDTERLYFQTGSGYNDEVSIPLKSGVRITDASFNISKGSNYDTIGLEEWSVMDESDFDEGSYDNTSFSSDYGGLILDENASSEDQNLLFYASFDNNYTAESPQGEPDANSLSITNVTGYSGSGIYPINSSSYLSYSTVGNLFEENGTISFDLKRKWENTGIYYIFTTSNDTDEFACHDLESMSIYVEDGYFYFRVNGDTSLDSASLICSFNVSSWSKYGWHHLVCTWRNINGNNENSFSRVYVDGTVRASAYGALDISSFNETMYVGSIRGASLQARAYIDEFFIFNKTMTFYNVENDGDTIIDYRETGTYTSEIFSTSSLVRWGDISWSEVLPFNSSILFQTRSAEDATISWSGWSEYLNHSTGSEISSPMGKYLQFRTILTANDTTETPVADDIVITYSYNNFTLYTDENTFERGDQSLVDIYASPGDIVIGGDSLDNNATTRFLANFDSGLNAQGLGTTTPLLYLNNKKVGGRSLNGTFIDESTLLKYSSASNFFRNSGTVEFWIKSDWSSGDERDHYLFAITDDFSSDAYLDKNSFVIAVTNDSEVLRVGINDDSTNQSRYHQHEVDIDWDEGEWYFVSVTWKNVNSGTNNSWSKVYVDGVLESSLANRQTSLGVIDTSMYIGQVKYGGYPAVAAFDELRILDVPLNSTQIQGDYECYYSSKNYVSQVIDIDEDMYWPRVAWEETLPSGTSLDLKIRTSLDNISWTGWYGPVNISTGSSLDQSAGRYMQYSLSLNTTDQAYSPKLSEIRFIYSKFPTLIDSSFEGGTVDNVTIHDDHYIQLKTREFVPDSDSLFLAHYNEEEDADYANGSKTAVSRGTVFEDGQLFKSINVNAINYGGLYYQSADNFNKNQGSIQFWCKPDWSSSTEEYDRYLFSLSSGNSSTAYSVAGSFTVFTSNNCSKLNLYISDDSPGGASDHHHSVNIDWDEGEWYNIAFTWGGINGGAGAAYSRFYIDGVENAINGKTTAITSIYSKMYIGSVRQYRQRFNGSFDELLIYDTPKSVTNVSSDRLSQLQLYNDDGTFVSNSFQMPSAGCYNTICWDCTDVADDTAMKLQVRTATTQGGLTTAQWKGPSSPGDYYTFSGEHLNYNLSHSWIQYKMFLSTTSGNGTSTVTEVRLLNESYPSTTTVDIADDGDIDWSYNPAMYMPQSVSGTTVIDALNDEIPDKPGMDIDVSLNITSSSGQVKLYNLSVTYKGMVRFRGNVIEGSTIGLEVGYGEIMIYDNTFANNVVGIMSVRNATPIVYDCSIVNCTYSSLELYNASNATFIETTFSSSTVHVYDVSELEVKYFINMSLANSTTDQLVADARVRIYNVSNSSDEVLVYDEYSNSQGFIREDLLLSYRQTANDVNFTLYKIQINNTGDDSNLLYFISEFNTSLEVFIDGDSDRDLIADLIESNREILWFEAESHVEYGRRQIMSDAMASGGAVAVKNDLEASSVVILDDLFPVSGAGPYKCLFRARAEDVIEGEIVPEIEVEVWEDDDLLATHSPYVGSRYSWFGTDNFTLSNGSVRLIFNDNQFPGRINLDSFVLVNLSNRTPGQISNPLEGDSDGDMLFDGLEIRENSYWFEAEEYVNSSDKLYKDKYAYNSTAATTNITTPIVLNTSVCLVSGEYMAYVRGRSPSHLPGNNLMLQIGMYTEPFRLSNSYRWHQTEIFQIITNGTYNIIFTDLLHIPTYPMLIDKFAIIRIDDIHNDTMYSNDVPYKYFTVEDDDFTANGNNYDFELRLPGDAYVTNATFMVNYTSMIHNFTYALNQSSPSIWEDLVVWVEYNFTYGRDIICLYNYTTDTDGDGIPNYVDTTDNGSDDTYGINDDNDWFLDLNGIVGFQPYSEDEVWEDTNGSGIFDSGDTCKYPGRDGTNTTNYSLSYYGELIEEEIYGNSYDDDGDGDIDEDCRDGALHILGNATRDCYEPKIHNDFIVWYNMSVHGDYDVSIYSIGIDTDADGTPNYLDRSDYAHPSGGDSISDADTYCYDDDGDASDSDGDGYCDGEEVLKGTDPYNSSSNLTPAIPMDFEYWVDEEILNGVDDDGDGSVDEDCRDPAIIWVNGSRSNETEPDVWGQRVVYQADVPDWDLYLINITMINNSNCSFELHKISASTDYSNEINPAIYEDTVVWQDDRYGFYDIYMTYVSRSFLEQDFFGEQVNLDWQINPTDLNHHVNPDIYGNTVVWQTQLGLAALEYNVMYKENWFMADSVAKYISQDWNTAQEEPQIYGNMIVWQQLEPSQNWETHIFDVNREIQSTIFSDLFDHQYPAIWGDRIVWQNTTGGLDAHIMVCSQDYIVDIGNGSYDEWHGTRFPFYTQTFQVASVLNYYLDQDRDNETVTIPVRFHTDLPIFNQSFNFSVVGMDIWYEFVTDPLDPDTDGDDLSDGHEVVDYFGHMRIETEDAIDIHEWKHSSQNFLTQTGGTLTSSYNYDTDTDEGYQGSWVKLRTNVSSNGLYKLRIEPDKKVKRVISKNYCSSMEPAYIGGGSWLREGSKYSTGYTKHASNIRYDSSLHDHVQDIFDDSLIFTFRDMCGNIIPVETTNSRITIYEVKTESTGSFFEDDLMTKGYVKLYWSFEGQINLTNDTWYEICVGLDLSGGRSENTAYKLLFDRIDLLQILNLDYIALDRQSLDPMKNDTDGDGLSDGWEYDNDFYPLNDDVDNDGLSDGDEEIIGSSAVLRDSDGDMIRDGIETGLGIGSSMGSWAERTIINGNPYDFTLIGNIDADPFDTTDPIDMDSDDDGLPDGWIDGWIYEPFPSSEAEIDTYDQEDAILRQMRIWQYDVDNWKNGGEVDSTQQIYEGEDFNLDGAFDNGAYHFSAKNLEIVRGETDPFQFSSDLDSIPDGYEVWYAQFEPLLTQDGLNYLIDPRANDGDNDCDVNFSVMGDIKVSNASTHAKGGNYPVSIGEPESGSTIYSIAQNFTIIQNTLATKVGVYLNLTPNNDGETYKRIGIEIWKYPGNPDGEPMETNNRSLARAEEDLLVDDIIIGDSEDWYFCDIEDRLLNGSTRYYLVLRYLGDCPEEINNGNYGNFSWFRNNQSGRYWYQEKQSGNNSIGMKWCYNNGSSRLNSNFSFKLYGYDYGSGDWLDNEGEYIVGTNPKNPNTDNISEPYRQYPSEIVDDGLIDGQEVGVISNTTFHGGVIFRTNVFAGAREFSYYGEEDDDLNGTDSLTEWINYDGDGAGYNNSVLGEGTNYSYSEKIEDPSDWEMCCAGDNVHLFTLDDGTRIYISQENRNKNREYIFVWSPDSEYGSTDADDGIVEGTCYIYASPVDVDMDDYGPLINFRYQQLFLSDPFSIDTDSDGLKDGEELAVNDSGVLDPYSWRIEVENYTETIVDTLICVRDADSDNDDLGDNFSEYWDWNFDNTTGDVLNNFADWDSDDDGLMDGDEVEPLGNEDGDAWMNMQDNDSDGDGLEDHNETLYYVTDDSSNQDINEIYDTGGGGAFIERTAFAPNGSMFCILNDGGFDIIWFPSNYTSFNETNNHGIMKTLKSGVGGLTDITVLPNGTLLYATTSSITAIYTDFSEAPSSLLSFTSPIKAIWADELGNVFIGLQHDIYKLDSNFNTTDAEASLHLLLDNLMVAVDICTNGNGDLFLIEGMANRQVSMLPSNYSYDVHKNDRIKLDVYLPADEAKELHELGLDRRRIGNRDNIFVLENIGAGVGYNVTMIHHDFDRERPINIGVSVETVYTTSDTLSSLVLQNRDVYFSNVGGVFKKLKFSSTSMLSTDTDRDGLWDGYNRSGHMGELNATHHSDQWDATYQTEEDSDGDGLKDGKECAGWYVSYRLVSSVSGTQGSFYGNNFTNTNPVDEDGDTDNDLLLDLYEYRRSNGTNNDTDGDGILDGIEDIDGDGRLDRIETSPIDQDTDDDRLPDGWMEDYFYYKKSGEQSYKYQIDTSPFDGAANISQAWEGEDLDCDGVFDVGESDPANPDSDYDGISDGDETLFVIGYNITDFTHHDAIIELNPDGDTISEGVPKISSLDTDSDNDGLNDNEENMDMNGRLGGIVNLEDLEDLNPLYKVWSVEDWDDYSGGWPGDINLPLPSSSGSKSVKASITKQGNNYIAIFKNSAGYDDIKIDEGTLFITADDLESNEKIIFKFESNRGIYVDGDASLVALGRGDSGSTRKIEFTRNNTGTWEGITFNETSYNNVLNYTKIEYASQEFGSTGQYYSVLCRNRTTITKSKIDGTGTINTTGVYIYNTSEVFIDCNKIIDFNSSEYNQENGVRIYVNDVSKTDTFIVGNEIKNDAVGVYVDVGLSPDDPSAYRFLKNHINFTNNGIEFSKNTTGENVSGNYFANTDVPTIYCNDSSPGDWDNYTDVVPTRAMDHPHFYVAWETNPYNSDSDEDMIPDSHDLHNYHAGNESQWFVDNDGDGLINAMDIDSDDDSFFVLYGDGEEDYNKSDPSSSMNHNGYYNSSNNETNPLTDDSDDDGIKDGVEVLWGTYPNDPDSDNDGLKDGEEILWNYDIDGDGKINAMDTDSDSDGIDDGVEMGVSGKDSDPTTTTSMIDDDTDGDGWKDGEEDTDGDGEIDGDENHNGIIDGSEIWDESSPTDGDSDDDGVLDGDEGKLHKDHDKDGRMNIVDTDSDNDNITDGVELGYTELNLTACTNRDVGIWVADIDPTTTTDPFDGDTDNDGIPDGYYDKDNSGNVEEDEAEDRNGNGMVDGDIDLDGEIDWGEDTNYNGILDEGEDIDNIGTLDREYWTETDANNSDTDDDGLDDGVERGLDRTQSPKDSDTKSNEVKYDADPRTTTDPLHIDSDRDGLPDGWKDGWGFNESCRLWGVWTTSNTVRERSVVIDVNGHVIVLAEYEDIDTNGAVAGDENSNDVMDAWETWTETSANNADGDEDSATDGQECGGWYVTIFHESDPTDHDPPVKVYSDPLDEDSDNDGLGDAEEMIFGGNPNKEDTDGDGYLDDQEFSNGSTLSGKEANPPRISLFVDPDIVWEKVYFLGRKIGKKPTTSIFVEAQGIDVSGIREISVNVKSSGLFGGKEETKTQNGMNFIDTFTFSFGLVSLVGEVWTGWTVTAEVIDNGGNTNATAYHVKSGVQVVLDLVGDTMDDLYKAGKEFLWDMVEASYYLVEEGLKNGGKNTFNRIVSKGVAVFDNGGDSSNFDDSIEQVLGTIFNPVDKLLSTFTDFVKWAMVILKRILDEVWNDLSNLFNRGITMIKNLFMPEGYEDVEVDEEEQDKMMDEISGLDNSEESINGYIMDELRSSPDPIHRAIDDPTNIVDVRLDHLYGSSDADDFAVLLCTQEKWNDAEQFEDVLVPRGYQIVTLEGDMATSVNLEATLEKLIYMTEDNDNVVVNIASHGSKGSFILNDGRRSYGWLDELLDKIPARITVIIDSCYSGSARPSLAQEGREVYTSVGADEVSTGVYDRRFAEALDIAEADVDGDGVVEMWEADRWGNGLIWMLKSGVAFRSDFDKDGLSDILENNTAFWNSIGVFGDDLPYWKIPDLYVELDWMKGFKPDIFGTFTAHLPWATALYLTLFTTAAVYFLVAILCFLGVITAPLGVIGLIIALVAMVAGFVVYHATEEVINIKDIFKDHNINLHIDDGCMGGGEGNIPYSPSIDDDEIYQSNSTYFDPRRMGKFYYGVFCDEIPGLIYGKGWGDSFLIAKGEIGSQKSLASHFIHELGHCIIEEIDNGSDADHPDHRSEGWFDDYKWTHCDNDCAMYYTGDTYRHGFLLTGRPVDYCSDCWHELERDGIGGGSV